LDLTDDSPTIISEHIRNSQNKLENRNDYYDIHADEVLSLYPFTKIRKSIDREFSESIKRDNEPSERHVKKLKFTSSQISTVSYPLSSPREEPQQFNVAPIDSMFSEDNFSLFDDDLEKNLSRRPFTYLSEKDDDNIWIKGYLQSVVKGSFKTLNNKFTLQANIEDGSDKITVTFDHNVLEPLLGISVDEFHSYQLDNSKISLLKSILLGFQNKLKMVQGLFHIVNRFVDPLLIQIESPLCDTGTDLLNSSTTIV
jgi:hypothetical protein